MDISIAKKCDLSNIMQLFARCIKDMNAHGIDQWSKHYPTSDIIIADIKSESMYVVKKEQDCIAVVVLNDQGSPEYRDIQWSIHNGRALYVHRLAVHPTYQRRQMATGLMDFAVSHAKANEYVTIRLDVYGGNSIGVRFYEKVGYQKKGKVNFREKKLPFFCYDMIL